MYHNFTFSASEVKSAPLLLSAWSQSTTLSDWLKYSPDLRKRTTLAAAKLPYKNTPRSGYEAKFVSACRGVKAVRP